MKGFRQFLLRGNVVDLAVGVVIGAAFGSVVTALVQDLITPVIAAFGGVPDFSMLAFTINGSRFAYGHFVNTVLSFLLIGTAVYFLVVLPVNTLMQRFRPSAEEPTPTRDCPECLSSIPKLARRCAFCGVALSEPARAARP